MARSSTTFTSTRALLEAIEEECRDQRREFQALAQELAHCERRLVTANRSRLRIEDRVRRAANLEAGLPEFAGFEFPGQAELPAVAA